MVGKENKCLIWLKRHSVSPGRKFSLRFFCLFSPLLSFKMASKDGAKDCGLSYQVGIPDGWVCTSSVCTHGCVLQHVSSLRQQLLSISLVPALLVCVAKVCGYCDSRSVLNNCSQEHICNVGRVVNRHSHYGKQYGDHSKN